MSRDDFLRKVLAIVLVPLTKDKYQWLIRVKTDVQARWKFRLAYQRGSKDYIEAMAGHLFNCTVLQRLRRGLKRYGFSVYVRVPKKLEKRAVPCTFRIGVHTVNVKIVEVEEDEDEESVEVRAGSDSAAKPPSQVETAPEDEEVVGDGSNNFSPDDSSEDRSFTELQRNQDTQEIQRQHQQIMHQQQAPQQQMMHQQQHQQHDTQELQLQHQQRILQQRMMHQQQQMWWEQQQREQQQREQESLGPHSCAWSQIGLCIWSYNAMILEKCQHPLCNKMIHHPCVTAWECSEQGREGDKICKLCPEHHPGYNQPQGQKPHQGLQTPQLQHLDRQQQQQVPAAGATSATSAGATTTVGSVQAGATSSASAGATPASAAAGAASASAAGVASAQTVADLSRVSMGLSAQMRNKFLSKTSVNTVGKQPAVTAPATTTIKV